MRRAITSTIILLALTLPANAQTGLGLEGGVIHPFGDFSDSVDFSPAFGARWEIQDVNALSQVATVSFLLRGLYGLLQTDSQLSDALAQQGQSSDDGGLLELGAAVRAYSIGAPLFLGLGAHYANLSPVGGGETAHGFGGFGGLGLRMGPKSIKLDLEARVAFLIPDKGGNLTYATYVATIGFPF